MLTDVKCRNAKPGQKPVKLSDEKGLFLLVAPAGGKWWRLRYRYQGAEKMLSLGTYPEISLADARERRDGARKLLAQGIDPSAARKAEKAGEVALAETFEIVAREWHERFKTTWTAGHADRILTSLEKDAFPWIGSRPINELTPPEVLAVARRVESRGALESAHRLVGNIGMACRFAVATGRAESDPTASLKGALPPAKSTRMPALTQPWDVGGLLRSIDAYAGSFVVKAALRLLPHVVCRPGELRFAEWREFDLDDERPTWNIPPERMKMRRRHVVPLSKQAVAILKELHPLTGDGKLLFPSERTRKRPISENTLNAALRRMGYTKDQMVSHGWRAIFSTTMNEMGWPSDAIERQLAHAEKSKVRGAYDRSQHLAKRREMLEFWSNYLDRLRDGDGAGKITPLFRVVVGK